MITIMDMLLYIHIAIGATLGGVGGWLLWEAYYIIKDKIKKWRN